MIDKQKGSYILVCDYCEEAEDEIFDDFYEAVDYKKENGWKSIRAGLSWRDMCPECQEEES